jgi:hypothetical protein
MSVFSIATSAARTATGQSAGFATRQNEVVNIAVAVTAHSGTTPTLDLSVEWSNDGSTWFSAQAADTFTQVTTTDSNFVKQFVCKAPQFRVKWTIAGTTPSYTFSIMGSLREPKGGHTV